MEKVNYTPSVLAEISSKPCAKRYMTSDITGMTVIIAPCRGETKISFYLRFLEKRSRKQILIGTFPEMTLNEARAKYAQLQDQRDYGHQVWQPTEHKSVKTFGAVYKEWRETTDVGLAFNTIKKRDAHYNCHIITLDSTDIKAVTPDFMLKWLKPLTDAQKYDTAMSIAITIRNVLDYAVFKQILTYNPLARIGKFLPKKKHEHYAAFSDETLEADMRDLFAKMRDVEKPLQCLMYLYFFTLLRNSEARCLTWEQIKPTDQYFTVKTKTLSAFKVPYIKQSRAIFNWLDRNWRTPLSPYVFHGRSFSAPYCQMTMTKVLKEHGFGDRLSVHGIRSCGRQWFQEQSDIKDTIAEMCLSHVAGSAVEQAYNRGSYVEERRKALQKWGDFVEKCAGDNLKFIYV